jgi:hypothetical protein
MPSAMSGAHIPKYSWALAQIIQVMWLKPIFIEYIIPRPIPKGWLSKGTLRVAKGRGNSG